MDDGSPADVWGTRIGWAALALGVPLLAYSLWQQGKPSTLALALIMFGSGLLGAIGLMTGRGHFGLRATCMIPILLIGGLILLVASFWETLFPYTGPVTDKSSVLYNCYSWDHVTTSMVDTNICIYGKILKYSPGTTTADIYFSNDPSDFHIISTQYEFPGAQTGQCVTANGVVASYYGALVIDISDLHEVTPTTACDR